MEVALHRDAVGDAMLYALLCLSDKRHTAGVLSGGNAVFGDHEVALECFCHLAEDVFQCLRIDLVIHLGQFCALRGALADKDLRLGYAEHLCILHGSMMILLFIRSRVFSVPIVTGLCGAKRIIFHVIGKFFVERSELHEFLSLIPIFCLAVPIAFCYSGVRKSRTQFTQKGGKTLCSKRNPVPVR